MSYILTLKWLKPPHLILAYMLKPVKYCMRLQCTFWRWTCKTSITLFKGKYRHVPVHFDFCVGTLLLFRAVVVHIKTRFACALYTIQIRKENSDVSSLFTDSFKEDNKKTLNLHLPESVETQPCFFIESDFHLVILYSCIDCMVVT